MQSTTIIYQLELRSHSCFLFLINHRLILYFSKDCRSSHHKLHWCLQGFFQLDHSWLQYKYPRGANTSKSQFAQMTVSLPALTKEHGHGAYALIHLIIRFLLQGSTETKHLHGLNVNSPQLFSQATPAALPRGFPLAFLLPSPPSTQLNHSLTASISPSPSK